MLGDSDIIWVQNLVVTVVKHENMIIKLHYKFQHIRSSHSQMIGCCVWEYKDAYYCKLEKFVL